VQGSELRGWRSSQSFAGISLDGFNYVDERAQGRNVIRSRDSLQHEVITSVVHQSVSIEPLADHVQPWIHRVYVGNVCGRPQPLGNGRHARPDSRVEGLARNMFAPHASLAAKNLFLF